MYEGWLVLQDGGKHFLQAIEQCRVCSGACKLYCELERNVNYKEDVLFFLLLRAFK